MEDNYKVYFHKNKINGKIYIGVTRQPFKQRCNNGRGYIHCPHFYPAILKYGWDKFEHVVLMENLSKEVACICERCLIKKYNTRSRECGYNADPGGGSFPVMTDEVKNRLRQLHLNKHPSKETIEKQRRTMVEQRGKPVVLLNSGQVFDSVRSAAESVEHCSSMVIRRCCNGIFHYGGTMPDGTKCRWKWLDSKNEDSVSKTKIQCLETGSIFYDFNEAAAWGGLTRGAWIKRNCDGITCSCGYHPETHEKLHWQYIE